MRGADGVESASRKRSHEPEEAAAPVLRARLIWLTGSKTTEAPAARATSAVQSVELLSQTMTSHEMPAAENDEQAEWRAWSVAGRSFSSFHAGMTMLRCIRVRGAGRECGLWGRRWRRWLP